MQKEIKASVTSSLIWVILGSLGLIFLLFNLPSALQKNDTVGLVFSGIFGIILLGIVIAFGHLAIKAPKKSERNTKAFTNVTLSSQTSTSSSKKRHSLKMILTLFISTETLSFLLKRDSLCLFT